MGLIVDVSNVLHAGLGAAGGGTELGPERLARLIASSRYRKHKARLVCDGGSRRSHAVPAGLLGAELIHSGKSHEADDVIEDLIRKDSAPKRLIVVSSDRRIVAAARKRKAATLTSEAFVAHLLSDASKSLARPPKERSPRHDVPLGKSAVEHWLKQLQLDRDEILRLPSAPDAPIGAARQSSRAPANHPPRATERPSSAKSSPATPAATLDPLLLEAIRAFAGRISPEDLDMERWLRGG